MSPALEILAELCAIDAPTGDAAALEATGDLLAHRLAALGVEVVRHPGGTVEGRVRGAGGGRPLVIACHYDTVWPAGTAARRPLRIAGDTAYGPGVFDMRGGIAAALAGLGAALAVGPIERPVRVLLTPDEESGSQSSRALLEAAGREAEVVLVPEPPLAGGGLKTSRAGVLTYDLRVEGRASHAGLDPDAGISAVHALARIVCTLETLARPELGTRLNVGVVRGGTEPNVVAAEASALVDVRVLRMDERDRVVAAFGELDAAPARASVTLLGERPPMERTPAIAAAVERARAVAGRIGQELPEGHAGGASDGNFLAPLGVAVLDGLGADGAGAHAEDERILLPALERRAALIAALIRDY